MVEHESACLMASQKTALPPSNKPILAFPTKYLPDNLAIILENYVTIILLFVVSFVG